VDWQNTDTGMGKGCFWGRHPDCRLFVPRGTKGHYTGWQGFDGRHVLEPQTVSVASFSPAYGTVAAEGELFMENMENGEDCIYTWDTVRLKATPRFGYRFVNWTSPEGEEVSAENPYTLPLTGDAPYTLPLLTAHFTLINGPATEAFPVAGEAQAGYGGGRLHLLNLEGYDLSVVSSDGRVRYRSKVSSADEGIRIHLPAGIYILSAVRGTERKNFKTIIKTDQ
jgi:hypothetical protein